jgi:hypothetical protein
MRLLLAVFLLAAVAAALEVRDWNDRPLGYGTVAVYDEESRLVALSYVVRGDLVYGVPWRRGFTLRVAWGVASLGEVASGRVIWVYDSAVVRDVVELGAPTSGKIRTWVYSNYNHCKGERRQTSRRLLRPRSRRHDEGQVAPAFYIHSLRRVSLPLPSPSHRL